MVNSEIVQELLFFEPGLSSISPHANNIKTTLGLTRSIEHQEDSMTGKWEASGATEHSKDCHGRFNWLHPKTLANLPHDRKIRELLEVNNLETKAEYDKSIKC